MTSDTHIAEPYGFGLGTLVHNQRWRSGVPLGGLGCGKLELLTDGALGNFTGNHNWDRPTGVIRGSFFAVRDGESTTLLRLKRPGEYPDARNVTGTTYSGMFPRARVRFDGLPFDVELEAGSPLIPHDIDDSALPVAWFTFRLRAAERKTVQLLFSWENLLGFGGRRGKLERDDRDGNQHEPAVVGQWSGLRFTTTPGKPELVHGEYLALSDGPTTMAEHWDPRAGMLARDVALEPGRDAVVRLLLVWFLPQHVTEFRKRRKNPARVVAADASAALDTRTDTRWRTEPPTLPGETLELDLGRTAPLDALVVDNFTVQADFTAGFALDCSTDGQVWEPVPHGRERVRHGIARFTFPPRSARFWRVRQTGYGPDWHWNVGRVEARHAGQLVPIVSATGRVHDEDFDIAREDVGHGYLDRHASADDIARHVIVHFDRLERGTREWQDLVLRASLPAWLKVLLLNHTFPAYANSILTRDGRFTVAESPVTMDGACGTMDQRMAHHAFWLMFFPELDRRELELFADCQDRVEPVADGRIPHFCGNFHLAIGDPMVPYGTTDWPDLSCSWVMQVLKHYRWTGDRGFLDRCWPHVKRAMAWLAAADTDGDLIPEGGSTYDYEHLPRGGYVFTASVYLGALRAADEMARVLGENSPYAALFEQVQEKTLERLFDEEKGTFIKWRGVDEVVENTFVAPLAGDWMMRLTGLEPIFPPEVCESACREILARHAKSFHPIPPMEVTPDGRVHTKICFVLQHVPYLGCEAIYLGYVEDGLDVIRRVYDAAWDVNWSPWDCPLNIEAPHGRQSWLLTYMTATATWHVLAALTGITLDLPARELHFAPRTAYHGPVFFPTFWGWLDCEEGDAALRVLKVFTPGRLTHVNGTPLELEIAHDASWDLSRFALLPKNKTAPVRFPNAQPRQAPRPWAVRSVLEEEYDPAPIRIAGLLDDDPRTCWTTDRPMRPGDWVWIDLGTPHDLKELRCDHREAPDEIPRGLRVEVSADGQTWQEVAAWSELEVRERLEDGWLTIPCAARARHIRFTQLGRAAQRRWSIHGVELQ